MDTRRGPAGSGWTLALTSAIRAAFGIIWAIDAYITWQQAFAAHYVGYLRNAAQGQPPWIQPWFAFWIDLVTPHASLFVWLTRILETAIAIGLLAGLARRWMYVVGGLFSLLIWVTAEGLGGPYFLGAANLGSALAYVLVFLALIVFDYIEGMTPYSLDYYLEKRWPRWHRMAEWAPAAMLERVPARLHWKAQAAAIAGIVAALILMLGTLHSAMTTGPATPGQAAAAVSPLSLASSTPLPEPRDALLPPLLGAGDSATLQIEATDAEVSIASGVTYNAWTFGGSVPGPTLHLRQGQTVNVVFSNRGMLKHSIDFHAAEVAPNVSYRDVDPGQTIEFSFVAGTPGAFLYHCGTPPVLAHIANGMYGAIIVDPTVPLPPADRSYVLVQSEWYTQHVQGTLMGGDFAKMLAATPDEVVFNGVAFQYRDHPLPAKAGQRVRIYFVDAGPNLPSAFHVIGAVFSAVYPDADFSHALSGVSTYGVAPGQGVIFDVELVQAGRYTFVDHSMRSLTIGAAGALEASQ